MVGSRLRKARRLAGNQTPFMKANAPCPVNVTVPSLRQFPVISYIAGITGQFYPAWTDFIRKLARIIKSDVTAFADDGVTYIQLDAPRNN